MFLSSENTYLRALEPTDLEFLYALENDTSVWHIGNTLTPYGAIDLFDFDPLHQRAGVGVVVTAAHRGHGHAGDALQLLLGYCQNTLQLHQVYCTVTATNLASINLFQKAEFEKVGIRREWLQTPDGWQDVVEFQRVF